MLLLLLCLLFIFNLVTMFVSYELVRRERMFANEWLVHAFVEAQRLALPPCFSFGNSAGQGPGAQRARESGRPKPSSHAFKSGFGPGPRQRLVL